MQAKCLEITRTRAFHAGTVVFVVISYSFVLMRLIFTLADKYRAAKQYI